MIEITEDAARVLLSFIGEHWAQFESHCENHGEDAQVVYEELGGEE